MAARLKWGVRLTREFHVGGSWGWRRDRHVASPRYSHQSRRSTALTAVQRDGYGAGTFMLMLEGMRGKLSLLVLILMLLLIARYCHRLVSVVAHADTW